MHRIASSLLTLDARYTRPQYLDSDPLGFVHEFNDPWDQEVVALIAAVLAYGNIKQIKRSVGDALRRVTPEGLSPREFVARVSTGRGGYDLAQHAFRGFVHRFNRGEDLARLLWCAGQSWERHGSIGAHFLTHLIPGAPTIEDALNTLIADWRAWLKQGLGARASIRFLLTAPSDGSCCKRWCMFLRWMVRKDGLDLGLWTEGSALAVSFPRGRQVLPSQLIMPLDTHTGRVSRKLGLTARKTLDWKAALEVTAQLRQIDPVDPVRFDFAMARPGILKTLGVTA